MSGAAIGFVCAKCTAQYHAIRLPPSCPRCGSRRLDESIVETAEVFGWMEEERELRERVLAYMLERELGLATGGSYGGEP